MGIQWRSDLRLAEVTAIIKEEVARELWSLAEHLSGVVQKTIRDKGAVASGGLLGSITPIRVGEAVMVGTPLEYGAYVETGVAPHWAPYAAIRQWVEFKKSGFTTLAIGVSFESGRAVPVRRGTKRIPRNQEVARLDRIAYAIQRKIAARGTQGKFFMRDSLDQLGIQYEVNYENGVTYEVDVVGFIERQGDDMWGRIIQRLN